MESTFVPSVVDVLTLRGALTLPEHQQAELLGAVGLTGYRLAATRAKMVQEDDEKTKQASDIQDKSVSVEGTVKMPPGLEGANAVQLWSHIKGKELHGQQEWNGTYYLDAFKALLARYRNLRISLPTAEPRFESFWGYDFERSKLPTIVPGSNIIVPSTNPRKQATAAIELAALSWMYGQDLTPQHLRAVKLHCPPLLQIVTEVAKYSRLRRAYHNNASVAVYSQLTHSRATTTINGDIGEPASVKEQASAAAKYKAFERQLDAFLGVPIREVEAAGQTVIFLSSESEAMDDEEDSSDTSPGKSSGSSTLAGLAGQKRRASEGCESDDNGDESHKHSQMTKGKRTAVAS